MWSRLLLAGGTTPYRCPSGVIAHQHNSLLNDASKCQSIRMVCRWPQQLLSLETAASKLAPQKQHRRYSDLAGPAAEPSSLAQAEVSILKQPVAPHHLAVQKY